MKHLRYSYALLGSICRCVTYGDKVVRLPEPRPCLLLLFLVLTVATGAAQTTVSSAAEPTAEAALTGTISNPKGEGVAGAIVAADNGAGVTQTAATDGQGLYAVELPAGAYAISVTAGGARIFEAKAIPTSGRF